MLGKSLDYQAKQITYNIYTFFKKRKLDPKSTEHINDVNVIDTVSEATGLSKSSVTRIIRAGNALKPESGGSVVFRPQEKKKHVRQKRIEVNEATETQIRRKVIQFYTVIKEVPSVRKLNAILKKENILHCSTEYLRQLLHKLGFTNADETDSAGLLRERPEIVSTRLKYLKAIIGFKNQKKSIFYLNDTSQWPLKEELENEAEMPTLVIVHACGVGFLDRATLMMKLNPKGNQESGLDSADNFDWIKNKVFKNIPENSVIVLNVPFTEVEESKGHDEKPTMGLSRLAMQEWLKHRNVPFKETESKANLLRLIRAHTDKAMYSIVSLLKDKGHEVLHLPKNQSDLNPVAVMWEAITSDLHDASPKVLIGKFSKEKWKICFEQVDEAENEYYDHDIKIDDVNHLEQLTVKDEQPEDEPQENESEIMDYE